MARPYRGPVPGFKGFSLEKEIQSDFSRASNTDIIPRIDTTALPPPIEGSVGWDVVTRRHYYANGTAWVPTGSGGAVSTIYNADDTLTGNRVVTGGANNLSFTGLGAFSVASDTASLTSTTSLTLDGGPTLNLDGTSLVLSSVPPTDNTNTDILTRDSVTGAIELRSAASIVGGSSVYDSVIPDDYPLLSLAIAAGDTHIFIRNGTYAEPAPVAIPPNSTIDGESRTNVNIQVAGGDGLTITGTKRASGGTITLTNGSATVAGAGTTFTAFSPGDAIVVLNMVVYVASVTNNTSLTLTDVYQGVTSAGNNYEVYLPSSLSLKNLNVTAPAGNGIVIDSILSPILFSVTAYDCGTNGISVVDCPYYYADVVVTFGNAAIGHSVADLLSLARLNNCFSNNNATRGFSFDFGTTGNEGDGDITLSNCSAVGNAIGIFSQRIGNVKISNCNASFNLTEGIRIQENAFRTIVESCGMANNGVSGLHLQNITGGAIQKHSINGCIFTNNVTNGIYILSCSRLTIGTNTIQDSQYGIQSIDNGTGLNRGHCVVGNVFRGLSVCAITYTEPTVISIVGNIGMNDIANVINFSGVAAYDARCTIVGNTFQISGTTGISLTNTNQISMGQNEFNMVNTATTGFLLVNSDFCRIIGNSVETANGGTTGVSIDANCTGTIVFGNYISSTTNGLVDAGAATLSSGAVWNN